MQGSTQALLAEADFRDCKLCIAHYPVCAWVVASRFAINDATLVAGQQRDVLDFVFVFASGLAADHTIFGNARVCLARAYDFIRSVHSPARPVRGAVQRMLPQQVRVARFNGTATREGPGQGPCGGLVGLLHPT